MDLTPYKKKLGNQMALLQLEKFQTDLGIPSVRLMSARTPHVCVVGAGVAGLRCAEVLLECGVKVTILEARDRVGGRVSPARIGFSICCTG